MGGGFRDTKIAEQAGDSVVIQGVAAPHGMSPRAPMLSGFAITHGVDADFFAEWLKLNSDSPLVRNRMVFSAAKEVDVAAQAREAEGMRSGLEPLDPAGDPRVRGTGRLRVETAARV